MSDKKNIITPFRHHGFRFLKMRFKLEESGKVSMRISRKSTKAIRRKLDIFRKWLDEGRIDFKDVLTSFNSWRAYAVRCNSYNTVRAMDERFCTLFAPELAAQRKPFKCTMKATKTEAGWIYRRHGAVREETAAA